MDVSVSFMDGFTAPPLFFIRSWTIDRESGIATTAGPRFNPDGMLRPLRLSNMEVEKPSFGKESSLPINHFSRPC